MGWTGVYVAVPRTMRAAREFLERETGYKIVSMKFGVAWGLITEETIRNRWPQDGKDRSHLHNLIVCILWRNRAGEFMYKEMSEDMGPFYYNIPLKYVDLPCKVANREWREKVRLFHQKQSYINRMVRKLKYGDTIRTIAASYRFQRMHRTMIIVQDNCGKLWRVSRKHILEIIPA